MKLFPHIHFDSPVFSFTQVDHSACKDCWEVVGVGFATIALFIFARYAFGKD